MSDKRNIVFKRCLAWCLLALLTLVHSVKMLHHHALTQGEQRQCQIIPFQQPGHHCAICDFHLTRDVEVPGLLTFLPSLQPVLQQYAYHIQGYFYLPSFHCLLRGPPLTA
ncbi:hypothetical protein [Chitinophaga silvisoli]|uniref:Uncharacterized protein n=1 Tax=Chitinophaga silvisoli TaxID=2291814 RepID=A0A3E1NTZ7_9BACT|nr:hypothetical protein [Chitinophaga silvisoli]RFM31425.1 hypothetical protein DXN04_29025 [Chitinophaga silvisoli]